MQRPKHVWALMAVLLLYSDISESLMREREYRLLLSAREQRKPKNYNEKDDSNDLFKSLPKEELCDMLNTNRVSQDYLRHRGVNLAELKDKCRNYNENKAVVMSENKYKPSGSLSMAEETTGDVSSVRSVEKDVLASLPDAELCEMFSAHRISEEFLRHEGVDVAEFKQQCGSDHQVADQHTSQLRLTSDSGSVVSERSSAIQPGDCFDWQSYNGSHCVCGNSDSCKGHTGGHVCDDEGNDYQSQCDFQRQMCNREISTLRQMSVCTKCVYLRLQGSSLFKEDPTYGLGIFKGVAETRTESGEYTEYKAMDDSEFMIMMVKEWENWVIGKRNASGDFITMKAFIAGGTSPLEVGKGGFMVLRHEDGEIVWDVDPLLHLECISEKDIPTIQKRFFFIFFIVAAVVVTTVSTTLKVVQSVKGCLYFPEVCDLRKEIEDVIKPRVEGKKNRFESNYGDTEVYKANVLECYTKTRTIRKGLVSIQELFKELGDYQTKAFETLKDVPTELLSGDFAYSLEMYEEYQQGLHKGAAISIVGLQIEASLAIYSLATTTVTTAAVAFAAVGAVIAVFIAVVDIISSITQEREIRDTLRRNKAELLEGERDIDKATRGMIEFQKEICKELLVPLSKLSEAGAEYSRDFQNFMDMLVRHGTFVVRQEVCNQYHLYNNIKGGFVSTLNTLLKTIIDHVQNDIEDLKCKVQLAKDLAIFADTIRDDVLVRKKKPAAILDFVVQNKPDAIRQQLFMNEFELIRHIAKNIMPGSSCYWGISLEPFRRGRVTAANYRDSSVVPPCSSPEVSSQTSAIASGVVRNYPPCRIISSLDPAIVRDISGLMRFIAHVTLPNDRCYWGYDLAAVRSGELTDSDLNNAVINSVHVNTLRFSFPVPNQGTYEGAKTTVCSLFKMCTNSAWVSFFLCMTNQAWGSVVGNCDGVPNADGCHINTSTYNC